MSENQIELTINGIALSVPQGSTLLEAARQAGADVPTLCWLPRGGTWASCLVCSVEVQGMRRLVPSCATPAQAGQVVFTDSDAVVRHRKMALELLLSDHVGDCIAPCQSGCPAHLDVPAMNQAILDDDLALAGRIVKDTIPLPATLGRICPTPCEGRCRRKTEDGAVSVCLLKRHVGDHEAHLLDPYVPPIPPPTGKRVAIIGAGPAGLSAAYFLLRYGHAAELFDDHEEPGGALRYEVPADRLPREILDAEIDVIRKMGAVFHLNTHADLAQLIPSYDAVVLAAGTLSEPDTPSGIERANRGVKVQKGTGQTSLVGVFAAGGAVAPGKISVRSIGDGHAVADSVHHFLTGEKVTSSIPFNLEVDRSNVTFVQNRLQLADHRPRTVPAGDGLSLDEAKAEAARCMQCGCAKVDSCVLRSLATRYSLDAAKFKGSSRPIRIDDSHDEILFEESKCTSCGICVRVAAEHGENLGLAFHGRGFDTRISGPFGEPLAMALKKAARACAEQCPTGALYLRPGLHAEEHKD